MNQPSFFQNTTEPANHQVINPCKQNARGGAARGLGRAFGLLALITLVKKNIAGIALGIILFTGISCERDNPVKDEAVTFTNTQISEWIYGWMGNIYLWNDKIGNFDPANEPEPL